MCYRILNTARHCCWEYHEHWPGVVNRTKSKELLMELTVMDWVRLRTIEFDSRTFDWLRRALNNKVEGASDYALRTILSFLIYFVKITYDVCLSTSFHWKTTWKRAEGCTFLTTFIIFFLRWVIKYKIRGSRLTFYKLLIVIFLSTTRFLILLRIRGII